MNLRSAAERSGRTVGAALSTRWLSEPRYAAAAREFNGATPENEMKWDATEPEPGRFEFERADAIMAFAEANAMKLRGHTLVWHSQLPAWAASLDGAGATRRALERHVAAVAGRYRGRVAAWDVVNEAWNEDGASLRDSVFHRHLGPEFLDLAFHLAREADPSARLFYNDYGAEGLSPKSDAIYEMLKAMKRRGVPVDGVGLQMHVGARDEEPSTTELAANLTRLAALGLDVAITEIDVHVCDVPGDRAERLDRQRTRYRDLVRACVAEPACTGITLWGVADPGSWQNARKGKLGCAEGVEPACLLFDDQYAPKPAYRGVLEGLLGDSDRW